LAAALNQIGRSEEALAVSDRSLRIRERTQGSAHPRVADEYSNRAEILVRLNRPEEALSSYRRAIDIWTREFGPEHPEIAYALTGLGATLTSLGRNDDAVTALEQALTIRERREPEGENLAETEFALAKALWAAHHGSNRAIELGRRALGHYGTRAASDHAVAEVKAWLEQRRVPAIADR
jgi:tetratricopeptide (TPR) repeat protein